MNGNENCTYFVEPVQQKGGKAVYLKIGTRFVQIALTANMALVKMQWSLVQQFLAC